MSHNVQLTSSFYKAVESKNNKDFMALASKLSKEDCIADPFSMLEIKRDFESGSCRYSRDKNFNNFLIYGYWKALFPDVEFDEVCALPAIEHGLILANDVYEEIVLTGRCTAVTFGTYRQQVIREKAKIPAFAVGPYVQYAQPFYDENRLKEERTKLGKTLLVFPSHSTDDSEVKRDVKRQIAQIHEVESNFDTVLISVFWWDIDNPMVDAFIAEGYKIVTAGFRDDPSFVSRQRTIIELSDQVLSDGIGTHVGFCRALSRPVKLMEETSEKTYGSWINKRQASMNAATESIKSGINVPNSATEQNMLDHYWGCNIKLEKDELHVIKQISKDITARSRGFKSHAWDVSKSLINEYLKNGETAKATLLMNAMDVNNEQVHPELK